MIERIKLAEKNIFLNNIPPITSTSITISHGNPTQTAEQLKQQILADYEFYGKFHNEHVYSLTEEEFKKLTEKAEKWVKWYGRERSRIIEAKEIEQENKQLKITLDECQRSNRQMNGNFLVYKDENDNLKQKLEKISNQVDVWINANDSDFVPCIADIKKILEKK